ncbi:MAG: Uma2 family endonuclease [Planctomycetota bacterium]
MTTAIATPRRRFATGQEWLDGIGNVPLDRVIFDPPPGYATEADHVRLEEQGQLVELIDSTLVEKPMGFWEENIGSILLSRMRIHADDHDLGLVNGPAAFMFTEDGDLRAPDVTFTSKARVPKTREPRPQLSPDLIVEVLSPSNTQREIERKLRDFFAGGTRLAWVVDPSTRTVAIHRGGVGPAVKIDTSGTLDGEDVLPGFSMPISKLFS